MSLKTYKTAVCAGALMSVVAWSGGVFAGISQNFESNANGVTVGTAGTLGAGAPTSNCGFPGGFDTHAQVLAITGTVTYTEGTAASSNASQVDLMFKAEPTDELDDLADQTDIKVALAVATSETAGKVSLKLWCKANGESTASWVDLCDVGNASWARATLVLDYTEERCRVSINGDPQVTPSAVADAWYTFANGKGSDNYLKSVTMVGSTEVDDFVVTHDALASYAEPFEGTAVTADGVAITYDDLNKYGVTVAEATANNDLSPNQVAGMTVSQKIAAGLNPKSATKFEMKTMSTTSSSAATITFPGNNASYTVTATADAAGTGTVLDTATVQQSATADANGEKTNTATFSNLPDNDLIYFHLKTN